MLLQKTYIFMEILQKKFPKKLTFSGNFNLFFITNQFFSFKINKKLLILNVKNGIISVVKF